MQPIRNYSSQNSLCVQLWARVSHRRCFTQDLEGRRNSNIQFMLRMVQSVIVSQASCYLSADTSLKYIQMFKLEGNCFTILCWFLLPNNVNQLWQTYVPSLWNLPPTPSASHPSGDTFCKHMAVLQPGPTFSFSDSWVRCRFSCMKTGTSFSLKSSPSSRSEARWQCQSDAVLQLFSCVPAHPYRNGSFSAYLPHFSSFFCSRMHWLPPLAAEAIAQQIL